MILNSRVAIASSAPYLLSLSSSSSKSCQDSRLLLSVPQVTVAVIVKMKLTQLRLLCTVRGCDGQIMPGTTFRANIYNPVTERYGIWRKIVNPRSNLTVHRGFAR